MEATFQCSNCGERKPRSRFAGKGPTPRDPQCRDCRNAQRRTPEYRKRDRQRYQTRKHIQNPMRHQRRRAGPAYVRDVVRKRAGDTLRQAVADGRIAKPKECQRCGSETPKDLLHGHHHDYSKPLDVEWLCPACHGKEHRKDQGVAA